MKRPALLDVNVLIAIFAPHHIHHEAAHAWFAANRSSGWATCPLTENGMVRILSNPASSPVAERPAELAQRLQPFLDAPVREGFFSRFGFGLEAHAGPHVRGDQMRATRGLQRIGEYANMPICGSQHRGGNFVTWWRRRVDRETEHLRRHDHQPVATLSL